MPKTPKPRQRGRARTGALAFVPPRQSKKARAAAREVYDQIVREVVAEYLARAERGTR
jgi:hypothetical protein